MMSDWLHCVEIVSSLLDVFKLLSALEVAVSTVSKHSVMMKIVKLNNDDNSSVITQLMIMSLLLLLLMMMMMMMMMM